MQRYDIGIAVLEFFRNKITCFRDNFGAGRDGQSHFGQNRKATVKIRHYNINILFIYSEQ